MNMLSALARSPEGKSLVEFAEAVGLSSDWENPHGVGVVISISGRVLNNRVGARVLDGNKINDEVLVHLELSNATIQRSSILIQCLL